MSFKKSIPQKSKKLNNEDNICIAKSIPSCLLKKPKILQKVDQYYSKIMANLCGRFFKWQS